MTPEEMRQLAEKLDQVATDMEPDASTAEQWTALRQLRDAARSLWAAYASLSLHDVRHGKEK